MNGPQMSPGYWNDPVRTEAGFLVPPGGDRNVLPDGRQGAASHREWAVNSSGEDQVQVKILGHRVELGEIEATIREELRIGWRLSLSAGRLHSERLWRR